MIAERRKRDREKIARLSKIFLESESIRLATNEAAPVGVARLYVVAIASQGERDDFKLSFNLSQRWREFNHELSPEGKSR